MKNGLKLAVASAFVSAIVAVPVRDTQRCPPAWNPDNSISPPLCKAAGLDAPITSTQAWDEFEWAYSINPTGIVDAFHCPPGWSVSLVRTYPVQCKQARTAGGVWWDQAWAAHHGESQAEGNQ